MDSRKDEGSEKVIDSGQGSEGNSGAKTSPAPRKKRKAKKKVAKPRKPKQPKVEEQKDLGSWAQGVLSDPALRKGIADRAALGTLTAQEMRALLQWATQAPPEQKRPSDWKAMLEVADPIEVQMIANIARRAMKKPEQPIYLLDQTEAWTNQEIIAGRRDGADKAKS